MAWAIEFDPAAEQELTKLGLDNARRILSFLSDRVATIIASIEDELLRLLIARVGHRRDVYRRMKAHTA